MTVAPGNRNGIRWRSSARLLVTLGITLTTALVLTGVLLVAQQMLRLSAEQAAQSRVAALTSAFTTYVGAGARVPPDEPAPTANGLLRSYLSREYPSYDELLVATPHDGENQLTLSKTEQQDDPLFPGPIRDRLRAIGRSDDAPASGTLRDADIWWSRATVDVAGGRSTLVVAVNIQPARHARLELVRQLLFASLAGLVLTALIAWGLAGLMLAPVRRVREAATTISADDLSRRVPVGGPDEIAALAHTLNAMLDRVEQASRTQRDFLDDAGHELRTPLTVVQGYLDLFPDDPVERDETLRIVQDELSRMTRIVEDLLTLARSDRPDFVRLAPTDLADLALDVELKTEVTADREWIVRPDADGVALLDQHRVTQALLQFCSNAVRFTRPGDRIEIGCALVDPGGHAGPEPAERSAPQADLNVAPPFADPRWIRWWVHDSGKGIPPGQEASIFERFHTARGQLRDGRGGTGLGLAIVSSIAHAHGGRAHAYNTASGGACFCLAIPYVPVASGAGMLERGILRHERGGCG